MTIDVSSASPKVLAKVLVVDDHALFRRGLIGLVREQADFLVVGEAGNGLDAVQLALQTQPDVILMDMVMPVLDGPATISQMREQGWTVNIIALTSFDDQALVQKAVQAGAVGFLHKDVHADKLAAAIRDAAHGRGTLDCCLKCSI